MKVNWTGKSAKLSDHHAESGRTGHLNRLGRWPWRITPARAGRRWADSGGWHELSGIAADRRHDDFRNDRANDIAAGLFVCMASLAGLR